MSSNGESADFNVESDVLNLDAEMEAVFIGANPIAATMNVYLDGDSSTQTFYHQENNTECFSEYISPFKSKAAFILHVLFHSNKDLSSERSIKKIMFAIEKLDFTKPDAVINYHLHILACPGKTAQMSSLSDFTENQWLNLNQGTKYKENPMFQNPMIISEEKFYTKNRSTYANVFQVYGDHVDKILSIVQKDSNLFLRCGSSVSFCSSEIVYDTLVGIQSQL
ncbi:hypothetical protein J3Q64DRAFT_1838259 [Phycomyces blakesleeanus]|uniref:BTB domain-containing protein n=1 Tax=Phycomyces blakesleeanus TaxID=4837 RepID=A0ABR3ASN9_PHYBL